MTRYSLMSALLLSALAVPAWANELPTPAAEKCFPADGIVKYYAKMADQKAARLDTLEAMMTAKFIRADETIALPKFWARSDGVDSPFSVSSEGTVTDFHDKVKSLPETAMLCGETRTPEGEEPKIGLTMDSDVLFKNRTGPYSLAELQDGVADGKSFYKKMLGGPMSLLVPSMTHVSLEYFDKTTPLQLAFTQAGQAVDAPPVETFGKTFVISLEDIEASGADTMAVNGGPFKLMPSPSVKKMKSLGFTAEDEESNENEKTND